MSPAAEAVARAVAHALDLIEAVAEDELPADVAVERVPGGLRLSGPRLFVRWAGDMRLRQLVATAARDGR